MIKIVKFLLISIIVVYLFWNIDIAKVLNYLKNYSIFYTVLTMLSVLLSDLLLALRWKFLTKNKLSFIASFQTIAVGAFLNFFAPAKLGEVSKILYPKVYYGCKTHKMGAVLIFERVFDVLFLALLSLFGVSYLFSLALSNYLLIVFLILGIFFGLLKIQNIKFLFIVFPKKIRKFMYKIFLSLKLLGNFKTYLGTFVLTFLIWVSYFLTFFIFINYAMGIELSILQILSIFIISSVAMSIPLAPGGAGTFQAGIVFAFSLYGVSKEEALGAGILLHFFMLFVSFLVALIIIKKKKINLPTTIS